MFFLLFLWAFVKEECHLITKVFLSKKNHWERKVSSGLEMGVGCPPPLFFDSVKMKNKTKIVVIIKTFFVKMMFV